MKVLLKVGYHTFLLPSDAGVQSVVKVLSRALSASDYSYRSTGGYIGVDAEPLEVSVKYLTAKTPIRRRGDHSDAPAKPLALENPTTIIIPPSE